VRDLVVALVLLGACKDESAADRPVAPPADARVAPDAAEPKLPAHDRYPDLTAALKAIIPADARVVGFGELHARVDRPNVRSSLAAFTEALPSFGEKVSDLVVETWLVDPKCGQQAVQTTKKIETEVKRPEATKSEIALLADAAKAAKIQAHAMTLACADYKKLDSGKGPPDPVVMLTLTTKELTRIATSALAYRAKQPGPQRPWIALYGGALHNDRFPPPGVAEWSYASAIDKATKDHYVEIDIFVPEFAEPDEASQKQPWFPLVANARQVLVWKRGERSFVVILPRAKK
jgi:hypothetical protein